MTVSRRRRRGPGGPHRAANATQTIVSFHAHPDDEALLTGGTLAMLAAAGHRVVLVVATSGAAGLSGADRPGADLERRRVAEVEQSAAVLGCARVIHLGYSDSGWTGPTPPGPTPPGPIPPGPIPPGPIPPGPIPPGPTFAEADLAVAAVRLAAILREESADVLTIYDRHGGYGHPDHVKVHQVGLAAARRAGTPRVLEATVDRTLLRRAIRALGVLHLIPAGTPAQESGAWYAGRPEITHRVPVGRYAHIKRAALACHTSQTTGGEGLRTVGILLALPRPVFRLVCGSEWFIETGAPVPAHPEPDLLTEARSSTGVRAPGNPAAPPLPAVGTARSRLKA